MSYVHHVQRCVQAQAKPLPYHLFIALRDALEGV
jgi:hypothetical protein